MNFNKIFCIGFNKTGTKTLEYVLRKLDYKLPDLRYQIISIVEQQYLGNYKPMIDFVSRYDAFQDNPFATGSTYIIADSLFPKSKFILTIRDPNKWFESLCKYHCKIFQVDSVKKLDQHFFAKKRIWSL